ncbi:hypothetical protein BHC57_07645 [Snodgrassella alvi]|uniref:Uncharacterized protein n=1 Tax=Snodgrassella alvi TaxID=1196083 RepID=A0A855FUI2_9NEIS|nr:hypothetical protein BHC57_07645 [Snodgrassella alvi]
MPATGFYMSKIRWKKHSHAKRPPNTANAECKPSGMLSKMENWQQPKLAKAMLLEEHALTNTLAIKKN